MGTARSQFPARQRAKPGFSANVILGWFIKGVKSSEWATLSRTAGPRGLTSGLQRQQQLDSKPGLENAGFGCGFSSDLLSRFFCERS